jgi:hypothetical protein
MMKTLKKYYMLNYLRYWILFLCFCFIYSFAQSQTSDKTREELVSGKWYISSKGANGKTISYDAAQSKMNWLLFLPDGTFTSLEDGMQNKGKWVFSGPQKITVTDAEGNTPFDISFPSEGKMRFRIYEGFMILTKKP